VSASEELTAADATIFETFVVPRYLHWFGELALELLVSGPSARILHVGCRTGYPDKRLVERVEHAEIVGLDVSTSALELARHNARLSGLAQIRYKRLEALPGDLEPGVFTHALALHPVLDTVARSELFSAMRWLLCSGGQAIVAMPLRGSFQEITDLFREYALKHDDEEFAKELEASLAERPSLETLSEQLESAGLEDVDVEVRQITIPFDSGRAFVDDPVSRLLILPEVRSWLPLADTKRPLEYVREAIDRYWSESKLELSLNVGAASARCP
jgi:ubiquinone/menaquinone biosynthesis C-methylase UbiE